MKALIEQYAKVLADADEALKPGEVLNFAQRLIERHMGKKG